MRPSQQMHYHWHLQCFWFLRNHPGCHSTYLLSIDTFRPQHGHTAHCRYDHYCAMGCILFRCAMQLAPHDVSMVEAGALKPRLAQLSIV